MPEVLVGLQLQPRDLRQDVLGHLGVDQQRDPGGRAARLAATYDALEARIEVLREQEELDKIRPELDGGEIMRILGLAPGPLVGQAWNYLLEVRLSEGVIGRERATAELLAWAAREGLAAPPEAS